MPKPYSLRTFMPQGEPQGLRVLEKTNWTGVGLIFPRTRIENARARAELGRTGVYVLWNDDDPLRTTIYVGQSENVAKRVKQHFDNEDMDWWTKAAAFTTKDDAFNQAHARYLEWALVQRARHTDRCEIQNRHQPSKPSISESDEADAEHFLEDLLQCLPLVGLAIFDDVVPSGRTATMAVSCVCISTVLESESKPQRYRASLVSRCSRELVYGATKTYRRDSRRNMPAIEQCART